MAYADDLAFTCTSREKLKKALAITEDWCITTGMEINKDKSAIMRIRKDRRTPGVEHGSGEASIMGFPVRTQYKYLGVTIEDTMEANKDNLPNKEGNKIAKKLARIFQKVRNVPVQMTIQRALARGKGNYASDVFYPNPNNAKRTDVAWRDSIKKSYRLPQKTSSEAIMAATLQPTPEDAARKSWLGIRKKSRIRGEDIA